MSTTAKEITYSPFRWFVLFALFVVTATTSFALISPAPLIGAIVETPGQVLSAGEITWMTMGWFNFAVALAALGGGYLIDKLGYARVHMLGLVLVGTGWLLVPVIGDTYLGMMTVRTIQGLGTGPIMASAAAVAATRFPSRERGVVTGAQGAAVASGLGLGQIVMPKLLVANDGDWLAALGSLWPIALVALVFAIVVLVGPKQDVPVVVGTGAAAGDATKRALRRALAQPVTWIAISCVVLNSWVYQAFNDLSPTYLQAEPPLGVGLGSALLGYAQLAYIAGSFIAGAATERLFRGRVRPGIVFGFAGGTLFALGMLLPGASTSSGLMLLALCGASFCFAWVNPIAMAYIAKSYPSAITGKLGGYAMGIGIFGGTAGVAVGSAALHATGGYTMSIVAMCAVCAIGAVIALFLRQPRGDQAGPDITETVPALEAS